MSVDLDDLLRSLPPLAETRGRPTTGSISHRVNTDGSITFYIRYQHNGRRVQKRIVRVRPEHRELGYAAAAAELARRRALRWNTAILGDVHGGGITWAQAAGSFGEWLDLHRSPKTAERYKGILANFTDWDGSPDTLAETSHQHLEDYKLHRLEDVGRTPSGINYEIVTLKRAWNWFSARARGWVRHDPFEDVEPLRDDSGDDDGHRLLAAGEVDAFRATAPEHLVIAFDFALNTGLRRNELVYLDVEDVDERRRVVHVVAKPVEGHRVKTHERRLVPLNNDAMSALRRQLQRREDMKGKLLHPSILFPAPGGSRAGEGAGKRWVNVGDQVKYWMRRSGFGDASMHDLRATFCTYLLAHTGDLRYVQKAMGHKRITTTEKYLGFVPDAHHMAIRDFTVFSQGAPP